MSKDYFFLGSKKKRWRWVRKDNPQNREDGTEFRIHRSFQEELKHISHRLVHKFPVIHSTSQQTVCVIASVRPPARIQKCMHNHCGAKVKNVIGVYI